jgi:hypothetical protein
MNTSENLKWVVTPRLMEEQYLYEGLIWTHAIERTVNGLNNSAASIDNITFDTYNGENRFYVLIRNGTITSKVFNWIIQSTNARGWIPTYFTVGNDKKTIPYESDEIFGSYLNTGKTIKLTFDAKFDNEYGESEFSSGVAYHVTPMGYKEKILEKGLAPKSKNKKAAHSARIYLSIGMGGIDKILQDPKFYPKETQFVIFKIDMKSLLRERSIRFFEDPAFVGFGCYTYENIPPKFITIEKEIKETTAADQ